MEQKDTSWKLFLFVLIASWLIAFLIIWYETDKTHADIKFIKELEKSGIKLQKKFDSLATENNRLTNQIAGINTNVEQIKKRDEQYKIMYDENESQIKKLRSKVDNLSRIDTFTTSDIKKYFSNFK